MRNFDPAFAAEIAKEQLTVFLLLELQFSEPLYYTDGDVAVVWDGDRYEPFPFSVGDVSLTGDMAVDSLRLELGNANLLMSAVLMNEDVRGKVAVLSVACLDASWDLYAEEMFRGFIGEWELTETTADITVVNEFVFWRKEALRTASATCPWVFKDADTCHYAGAELLCDRSWERCVSMGNSDNFGGFRYLPSIMEKQIWWGRQPK